MSDARASISELILSIDQIILRNLSKSRSKLEIDFAFRTGSTVRGDFAVSPEGSLVSDIEYLIICKKKYRSDIPIKAIRQEIDSVLKRNKAIDPRLVEISFSGPYGSRLRKRAYFFLEAVHEGVWLIGNERKHELLPTSLSIHFVNFTLLTRLYDLSFVAELLYNDDQQLHGLQSAAYRVAKSARHFCTMAYYRSSDVFRPFMEREAYLYSRHAEYRKYLEKPLEWSRKVYCGEEEAFNRFHIEQSYKSILDFAEYYIERESLVERWPIGRSNIIERIRDCSLKANYHVLGVVDSSICYRELTLDFLFSMRQKNAEMLTKSREKFSHIVGGY